MRRVIRREKLYGEESPRGSEPTLTKVGSR